MNFTAARILLIAAIALYFSFQLVSNGAEPGNGQTSPQVAANAAPKADALPKMNISQPAETAASGRAIALSSGNPQTPPCTSFVRSAAFAGNPGRGGEIRIEVTGSAEVLKVGSAKGYTEADTSEVCSAGECSIKTNNPGPYTLRFDACPPVTLGE